MKQLVEAVLFARYNESNYKALYGRLRTSNKYTKDYFQLPRAVSDKLQDILQASDSGATVEYVWPGGGQFGEFAPSTDRYHLRWETDTPPKPWKLGDLNDPLVSLHGDASQRVEEQADEQYRAIVDSQSNPWLLAIKLAGEGNRLHLRVYFEHPPAHFSDRAVAQLPSKLQEAISTLRDGIGIVDWRSDVYAPLQSPTVGKLVTEIQQALARDPNVLLVGPPGTGKSVALEQLRQLYTPYAATGAVMFEPTWPGAWSTYTVEARSHALVFHPSYTYENFVAGLFPKSTGGLAIELEAQPGPLLSVSHWVGDADRRALLILDEFNRGSAAAIFGDTLSLLDKDKRATSGGTGAHIQRPYPAQKMPVPTSFRRDPAVEEHIDELVRLPAGVHILAAMNSTDRSVAPLDAAMRRRFTVIRVGPDYEVLAQHLLQTPARAEQPLPTSADIDQWQLDDVSALAVQILRELNERIEYCLGEDFLLGHALVWGLSGDAPEQRLTQLAYAIDTKVVPTLRMTFVDQDEALAAILGVPDDLNVERGAVVPPGSIAYWKNAPAALAAIAQKRLVVQTIHAQSTAQQLAILTAMARH